MATIHEYLLRAIRTLKLQNIIIIFCIQTKPCASRTCSLFKKNDKKTFVEWERRFSCGIPWNSEVGVPSVGFKWSHFEVSEHDNFVIWLHLSRTCHKYCSRSKFRGTNTFIDSSSISYLPIIVSSIYSLFSILYI